MKAGNTAISFFIISMVIATLLLPISAGALTGDEQNESLILSNEELAQLLAPVALYPDPLLLQILIGSSYPFEAVEAERWLAGNPTLSGEALDNALEDKYWDLSIMTLCHYPKILNMMVENLKWTARLGDAFVYQQQDIMDTIQDLRTIARNQGNLKTTNEQKIIIEEKSIQIVPVHSSYIYIPVYDPFEVYGTWMYPAFRPCRIYYSGGVFSGPGIYFSTRVSLRFGHIRWSIFDWPSRNVVIINRDRTKRISSNHAVYRKPSRPVYWRPDRTKRTSRSVWVRKPTVNRPVIKTRPHKTAVPSGIKGDRKRPSAGVVRTVPGTHKKEPLTKTGPRTVTKPSAPATSASHFSARKNDLRPHNPTVNDPGKGATKDKDTSLLKKKNPSAVKRQKSRSDKKSGNIRSETSGKQSASRSDKRIEPGENRSRGRR